jgi:mRNA interferase MazF
MKRGDVWWASCELVFEDDLWQGRNRPIVVLSSEDQPELRAMWIVAPATGKTRDIVVELAVGRDEGLAREGVLRVALPQPGRIPCDWLLTIASRDLVERAGSLSPAKLRQLEENLRLAQIDPAIIVGRVDRRFLITGESGNRPPCSAEKASRERALRGANSANPNVSK